MKVDQGCGETWSVVIQSHLYLLYYKKMLPYQYPISESILAHSHPYFE